MNLCIHVGVLPELSDADVKIKARLEPGKMFLVDFEQQAIVSDHVIKEEIAQARDYTRWLQDSTFTLQDWVQQHAKPPSSAGLPQAPQFHFDDTPRRQAMFGFTVETVDMLLYPMGVSGKEV